MTVAIGAGAALGAAHVEQASTMDLASVDHLPVPYHRTAMHAPLVTGIDVDPVPIRPTRVVTLSCVAAEVDGEPNQFRWLGPFGRTEESGSPNVRWTPGASGQASITCIARNHIGTSMRTFVFDVVGISPSAR